jgi:hypothetical protein
LQYYNIILGHSVYLKSKKEQNKEREKERININIADVLDVTPCSLVDISDCSPQDHRKQKSS